MAHAVPRRLKTTRKLTTHNAFFVTPDQRDAKLTETFHIFQRRPEVIARMSRVPVINNPCEIV